MAKDDEKPTPDERRQMILFDQWTEEPEVQRRVAQLINDPKSPTDPGRFSNGKLALRNDARCRRIIEALLADTPKRVIMREFKVGFETMRAIWKAWEESGRLRTVKDRLSAGWGEIGLITQHKIREALLDGTMPKNVLPMLGGVATDKHALLTGSATERIELKREVTVAEVEDAWAKLKAARDQVIDVEVSPTEANSEETKQIPSKSSATPFPDTKPDTPGNPVPAEANLAGAAEQTHPAGREDQAAPRPRPAQGGGGGSRDDGGGLDHMGKASEISDAKEGGDNE